MSYIPHTLPPQGDTTTNALGVEAMFAQILGAVQKSVRQQLLCGGRTLSLTRDILASRDIRTSPRMRRLETRQRKSRETS